MMKSVVLGQASAAGGGVDSDNEKDFEWVDASAETAQAPTGTNGASATESSSTSTLKHMKSITKSALGTARAVMHSPLTDPNTMGASLQRANNLGAQIAMAISQCAATAGGVTQQGLQALAIKCVKADDVCNLSRLQPCLQACGMPLAQVAEKRADGNASLLEIAAERGAFRVLQCLLKQETLPEHVRQATQHVAEMGKASACLLLTQYLKTIDVADFQKIVSRTHAQLLRNLERLPDEAAIKTQEINDLCRLLVELDSRIAADGTASDAELIPSLLAAQDAGGKHLLHHAAAAPSDPAHLSIDGVDMLLRLGAGTRVTDNQGNTPLLAATRTLNIAAIEALIKHDHRSVTLANQAGETAPFLLASAISAGAGDKQSLSRAFTALFTVAETDWNTPGPKGRTVAHLLAQGEGYEQDTSMVSDAQTSETFLARLITADKVNVNVLDQHSDPSLRRSPLEVALITNGPAKLLLAVPDIILQPRAELGDSRNSYELALNQLAEGQQTPTEFMLLMAEREAGVHR